MTTKTLRGVLSALLLALLPALTFAQGAVAPKMFTPFKTGGSISSGSAVSGCTAYSLVYIDSAGNLACAQAAQNSNVSTAGNAITQINATISGSSATSNFLNITGTFPATLTAATSAIYSTVAFDDDSKQQAVVRAVATGSGATANITAAVWGENGATGQGSTAGYFVASGNASSSTAVRGEANAGTYRVGGYFTLGTLSLPNASAALMIDNGAVAANIFEARDNQTAVFTIADGGGVTFTQTITAAAANFSGNVNLNGGGVVPSNQGLDVGSSSAGQIGTRTALTPDAPSLFTGTTSNLYHISELADAGYDFQAGRCGTSACGDPALIIHSRDQSTTEYGQISVENSTGAVGIQSNLAEVRIGGSKTAITESSGVAIVRVGIGTSTNVYGMTVFYTIYDINGANFVTRTGSVKVQGGNSSGTATCTINTTQDQETEDGSQVATSNAATLTYTWTNAASSTNCDLTLNAASSEGANTYAIVWTAVLTGNASGITITPQ